MPCLVAARTEQPAPPRLTEFTLEQLGDIEVTTVSKRPEEGSRTAVAVYVIGHEDIVRSGATSIPEVLRLAPGVEVSRIDSDHWAVGVRGFGDQFSKALLVLIDGRSIYTPLFAGMYWPAQDTLLDDVDRIEVIRGPGGTVWGANAVSGVINIITRSASQTRGLLASAGGGSLDQALGAVRYGGGNGTTFNYRVYGKGARRAPEFHADGADYDRWWNSQAGFRADWTGAAGQSFTLQGDVSKGSDGQRVTTASFAPPSQVALDGALDQFGANLIARWQREFSRTRGFHLQVYFDRTSWLAPHFGEKRSTVDVDFVHYVTLAGRHAITAGAGARYSPSDFIQAIPALDFNPSHETDSIYSAFVQDELELAHDRLWLTGGSKLEHNNYTGLEVEPSARLLWAAGKGQSIWAGVTRAVRTPSRIEEGIDTIGFSGFSRGFPVYLEVTGNPDFQAERVVSYQAGYRTQLASQAYLDVALFRDRHTGLSSFGLGKTTFPVLAPPPVHAVVNVLYVNGVNGTSNGFELSPSWQPRRWWKVTGSYAYVGFDLAVDPLSIDVKAVARYTGSSPHHQVRAQSQINLPHGTEFDAVYRYISDLPAQAVRAYHAADTRVAWALTPALKASVSGQNLLSPHHAEFGHTIGSGAEVARSVFAGLTWQTAGSQP